MKPSEEYLLELWRHKEMWSRKLNNLQGNTVDTNNPIYKMYVNCSNKYCAAKTMHDLMLEEIEQKYGP